MQMLNTLREAVEAGKRQLDNGQAATVVIMKHTGNGLCLWFPTNPLDAVYHVADHPCTYEIMAVYSK